MRDKLIEACESYLQGHIKKHCVNVENLLDNTVALAEHPDIVETIEKELDIIADYEDKLNVLHKYFPTWDKEKKELLNEGQKS